MQRGDFRQSGECFREPRRQRRRLLVVSGGLGEVAVPLQNLGIGVMRIGRVRQQLDLTLGRGEPGSTIAAQKLSICEHVVANRVLRMVGDEIAHRWEWRAETTSRCKSKQRIIGHQLRRGAE